MAALPSPARPILLPPNPAIVRLLGQRGPLGRGVRAKLLRCSALWGFPFGAARHADAVRSFIALRATAEPVRWRLPPALAAAFAEPEEATPAVPDPAAEIRAEPRAQRTEVAASCSRPGRNAEIAAEPHTQRSAQAAPPPAVGSASGPVPGGNAKSLAEPLAQRTGPAEPGSRAERNAEFAAEPHAQRYASAAPPPATGGAGGKLPGGTAKSRIEPYAQRTEAAEPDSRAGRNAGFAAEPHAQRYKPTRAPQAKPAAASDRRTARRIRVDPCASAAPASLAAHRRHAGREFPSEPHAQRYAPAVPAQAAGAAGGRVRGGTASFQAEPHAQRYAQPAQADGHTARRGPDLGKQAADAGAKPRHDAPASPLASLAAPAPNPRQNPMPSGNRGWLKNGATPGDFLAAPRCGARTRAGTPCRQPAMANGRCRLHGGLSTGPRTAEGVARIRAARTIHGAYAAPERARTLPLRSFIRRSQIFYDLWRLEAELPESARARLPALPPELSMPHDPGASPKLPSRKQERADAAAETARLAPWRLAIQAARAQRREGAVPPPLLQAVDQAFARLPPNQPLGIGTG